MAPFAIAVLAALFVAACLIPAMALTPQQRVLLFGKKANVNPPGPGSALALEDGTSILLLEDGSSHFCLEGGC